jgi:hypothetical protein
MCIIIHDHLFFTFFFYFYFSLTMIQDKHIGLTLAMSSSVFIGLSFIITKKGLINANKRHGSLHRLIFLSKRLTDNL